MIGVNLPTVTSSVVAYCTNKTFSFSKDKKADKLLNDLINVKGINDECYSGDHPSRQAFKIFLPHFPCRSMSLEGRALKNI